MFVAYQDPLYRLVLDGIKTHSLLAVLPEEIYVWFHKDANWRKDPRGIIKVEFDPDKKLQASLWTPYRYTKLMTQTDRIENRVLYESWGRPEWSND